MHLAPNPVSEVDHVPGNGGAEFRDVDTVLLEGSDFGFQGSWVGLGRLLNKRERSILLGREERGQSRGGFAEIVLWLHEDAIGGREVLREGERLEAELQCRFVEAGCLDAFREWIVPIRHLWRRHEVLRREVTVRAGRRRRLWWLR